MAKEYVLGFFFSPDKKEVALIKKTKPEWQAGHLNGIGGKIEPNEPPLNAMRREFLEETGFTHLDWSLFATMKNSNFDVYCYVGYGPTSLLKTTTEEEVVIVPVDKLQESNVLSNINWLVPMALDSGFEPVIIDYKDHDKYVEKK